MKKTVNAHAKINLLLDIEGRREDGYHDILSYMQTVTLHDTVMVEYTQCEKKQINVSCNDANVPCDESNLVYKAAEFYPIQTGEISISIIKHIPMSAGLAGGSADCAATLIALNEIFDGMLSMDELKRLGNKLGADVPFCIEKGSCIARGTGDLLEKAPAMPYCTIVIAREGEGMSTPRAYRALDEKFDNFKGYKPHTRELEILMSPVSNIEEYVKGFYNIFESVVESERPSVALLKSIMKENGAFGAMMSGSGTSVFGVFEKEEDAMHAVNTLRERGAFAELCHPFQG